MDHPKVKKNCTQIPCSPFVETIVDVTKKSIHFIWISKVGTVGCRLLLIVLILELKQSQTEPKLIIRPNPRKNGQFESELQQHCFLTPDVSLGSFCPFLPPTSLQKSRSHTKWISKHNHITS